MVAAPFGFRIICDRGAPQRPVKLGDLAQNAFGHLGPVAHLQQGVIQLKELHQAAKIGALQLQVFLQHFAGFVIQAHFRHPAEIAAFILIWLGMDPAGFQHDPGCGARLTDWREGLICHVLCNLLLERRLVVDQRQNVRLAFGAVIHGFEGGGPKAPFTSQHSKYVPPIFVDHLASDRLNLAGIMQRVAQRAQFVQLTLDQAVAAAQLLPAPDGFCPVNFSAEEG